MTMRTGLQLGHLLSVQYSFCSIITQFNSINERTVRSNQQLISNLCAKTNRFTIKVCVRAYDRGGRLGEYDGAEEVRDFFDNFFDDESILLLFPIDNASPNKIVANNMMNIRKKQFLFRIFFSMLLHVMPSPSLLL